MVMASITLKNIPEHLHLTYKRRAKQHARSLQAEILHTLGQATGVATEELELSVDDVAGCIKPVKRHASLQEMDRAVDAMFREEWKRGA
jgi:plasmid stability protein